MVLCVKVEVELCSVLVVDSLADVVVLAGVMVKLEGRRSKDMEPLLRTVRLI